MKKIIRNYIVVILLLISCSSLLKSYNKTVTHYNPELGRTCYHENNAMFCERFLIDKSVTLSSIRIGLTGKYDKDGFRLRIFGEEGGSSIPIFEKDIIEPIILYKSNEGETTFSIEIPSGLKISSGQFFVAIDSLNQDVFLLSDLERKPFSCIDKNDEIYNNQLIKKTINSKFQWTYGLFAFDISCEVNENNEYSSLFKEINLHGLTTDSLADISNASFYDFNNDNQVDIVINGKLFLNKGNFEFVESNILADTNHIIYLNYMIDCNKDNKPEIMMIMGDKTHNDSTINISMKMKLNEFYTSKQICTINSKSINSYLICDINNDNQNDLLFTFFHDSNQDQINDILLLSDKNGNPNIYKKFILPSEQNENIYNNKVIYDDLNNTGIKEIILNSSNNKLSSFQYLPNEPVLKKKSIIEYSNNKYQYSNGLEFLDLNCDGINEMIHISEFSRSYLIESKSFADYIPNQSNDKYLNNYHLDFQENFEGILVSDVDNNSYLDIITLPNNECQQAKLYLNDGSNLKLFNNTGFGKCNLGSDGILIDLNNDSYLDLVTVSNGKIHVFQNEGILKGQSIKIKPKSNEFEDFSNTKVEVYVQGDKKEYCFNGVSGHLFQRENSYLIGLGENKFIDSIVFIKVEKQKILKQSFSSINTEEVKEIEIDLQHNSNATTLNDELNVYPNPFSQFVKFEFLQTIEDYSIEVYDNLGNTVFKKIGNEAKYGSIIQWKPTQEELSRSGIYYYKCRIGNKNFNGKLVNIN